MNHENNLQKIQGAAVGSRRIDLQTFSTRCRLNKVYAWLAIKKKGLTELTVNREQSYGGRGSCLRTAIERIGGAGELAFLVGRNQFKSFDKSNSGQVLIDGDQYESGRCLSLSCSSRHFRPTFLLPIFRLLAGETPVKWMGYQCSNLPGWPGRPSWSKLPARNDFSHSRSFSMLTQLTL